MGKYDGMSVALGAPDVTITAEEFREYRELQAKKDRTILSLQAQMKLQDSEWQKREIALRKQALQLAREVNGAMLGDTHVGIAIVNAPAALRAYELAQEILASE